MIPQIALSSYDRPAANLPTTRPSRSAGTFASNAAPSSSAPSLAVTAGQFMMMTINASTTGTPVDVSSVTDTQGNKWTRAASQKLSSVASNHRTCEVWFAFANATNTITVTASYSTAPAQALVFLDTFNNVNPTQPWANAPVASGNDSTSNIAPSGSVVCTQPNSLLIELDVAASANGGNNDGGVTTWGDVQAGSPQCSFKGYWKNIDIETYTVNYSAFSNWAFFRGALKGVGGAAPTPVAVSSTFTFTGSGGANEANLYDGLDSTPAADPTGLQTTTFAAFDFGTFLRPTNLRFKVADVNGFTAGASFKIQYSDVSLSSGWTDTGPTTISVGAGTGGINNQAIPDYGSHKYWRIIYNSGSINTNCWIGELTFS